MKRIVLTALVCVAAAIAAAGQETTDTAAKKPEDSPLVKAAKASGGPKRKAKKVITNDDVKKATGKLIVLPAKPRTQAATTTTQEPAKGPLQIQDEQYHTRQQAAARVKSAEEKVADLEKELRRLEDAYYAENDPNYRDAMIEKRFNQTKEQLEAARSELAEARDAQQKLKP